MNTTTENTKRGQRRVRGKKLGKMPFVRVAPATSLDRRRLFKGLPPMPVQTIEPR